MKRSAGARVTLLTAMLGFAGIIFNVSPASAEPSTCPPALARAQRLILVTAPTMDRTTATLRSYVRARVASAKANSRWHPAADPQPVMLGRNGLGWAWTMADQAALGEPVKHEGDGRTPAGIFAVGRPFGFAPATMPGYLRLTSDDWFCVDQVSSPYYNQIVPRRTAGPATSGETMRNIELYRRGVLVDYPTNAEERGGSCIFLHIWKTPETATVGCIAGPEALIAHLQVWATAQPSAIAVLPERAQDRFGSCLPAVRATPSTQRAGGRPRQP